MQIPILVEPIAGSGFRALGGEPFALSAEGSTREEAVAKLREQLAARLSEGRVVVALEVPANQVPHPLADYAGMFRDDPYFKEVVEIMKENRKQADEDDSVP